MLLQLIAQPHRWHVNLPLSPTSVGIAMMDYDRSRVNGLPARIHGSVASVSRMYRAVSRLFR
eukprot:4977009-Prymnesium_polylepis.1